MTTLAFPQAGWLGLCVTRSYRWFRRKIRPLAAMTPFTKEWRLRGKIEALRAKYAKGKP